MHIGDNGKVISSSARARALALALQCDGNIIAGGDVTGGFGFRADDLFDGILVRYNICQLCCD